MSRVVVPFTWRAGTLKPMRVEPIGRTEWYREAADFRDLNYQHTWEFNLLAADRQGAGVEYVKIVDDSDVVGLASVRIKTIPLLGVGIAYIGGGPLIRREHGRTHRRHFKHASRH